MKPTAHLCCVCFVLLTAACSGPASYDPRIEPGNFVAAVTHPLLPLVPGTVFRYSVKDDAVIEEVRLEVLQEKKTILGVQCTVVRDVSHVGGAVEEDTLDWFAQDREGNVWYFGEDTTAFKATGPTKAGSWMAGERGAKPGIVMKAKPTVGDAYRQEYLAGEAEDEAVVLSVDEAAAVPFGSYTGCVKTKDFTQLEPNILEHKVYCPGVGQVLSVGVQGSNERMELVEVTAP